MRHTQLATLTIHYAAQMGEKNRKNIAAWLRQHAKDIIKDGKNYSKRFTGKYMAPSK